MNAGFILLYHCLAHNECFVNLHVIVDSVFDAGRVFLYEVFQKLNIVAFVNNIEPLTQVMKQAGYIEISLKFRSYDLEHLHWSDVTTPPRH